LNVLTDRETEKQTDRQTESQTLTKTFDSFCFVDAKRISTSSKTYIKFDSWWRQYRQGRL